MVFFKVLEMENSIHKQAFQEVLLAQCFEELCRTYADDLKLIEDVLLSYGSEFCVIHLRDVYPDLSLNTGLKRFKEILQDPKWCIGSPAQKMIESTNNKVKFHQFNFSNSGLFGIETFSASAFWEELVDGTFDREVKDPLTAESVVADSIQRWLCQFKLLNAEFAREYLSGIEDIVEERAIQERERLQNDTPPPKGSIVVPYPTDLTKLIPKNVISTPVIQKVYTKKVVSSTKKCASQTRQKPKKPLSPKKSPQSITPNTKKRRRSKTNDDDGSDIDSSVELISAEEAEDYLKRKKARITVKPVTRPVPQSLPTPPTDDVATQMMIKDLKVAALQHEVDMLKALRELDQAKMEIRELKKKLAHYETMKKTKR